MENLTLHNGKRVISKLWRRLALATLASVFVVGTLWMVAQATSQDPSGIFPRSTKAASQNSASGYGFSMSLAGLPPQQLNQRLDDMKASGATWVRYDLSWAAVQPTSAGSYNWAASDAITQAAEAHGFKVLMIVDFTPAWAREAGCNDSKMCAPSDPAAYGRFAAEAARHYQPFGVEDWEIWNEPNISYRFHPAADPTLYAAMLKASYTDIKQVDPNAVVVAGGTAPSATDGQSYTPSDFVNAIYAAGAGGYFDAISAHPYTYPYTPSQSNPADAWGQLTTMHDTMAAHGDGKKQIWITEFGAPTNGANDNHVTEDAQAQTITEAASILQQWSWSGPLFWYDYQDEGTSTSDSQNFFGLVRADGSFKPAYSAFKQATSTYTK